MNPSDLTLQERLPVLPLRDLVLFPHAVKSFFVGRPASIAAVEAALAGDGRILVVTQKLAENVAPVAGDLYETGTVGRILQTTQLEEKMVKVALRGLERARLTEVEDVTPVAGAQSHMMATFELLWYSGSRVAPELREHLFELMKEYAALHKKLPTDLLLELQKSDDMSRVTDVLANLVVGAIESKQEILAAVDVERRLELLTDCVQKQIERAGIDKVIKRRVKKQMEKNQREYYLNEKMKAIQKELGQDAQNEMDDIERRIREKKLPAHARLKCETELRKLRQMSPMSAEATVVRSYLEWVLALPWDEYRTVEIDLTRIKNKLDADHHGLEDVKDRIIEHLAVHRLSAAQNGPKLCFVGPPGVGKTSLARSIAEAIGLDYIRQSLGGVRDEAEIRGHRRTYIGALPGRIIQGLRKATTSNPLFLLDEVDKLGADFRGDPSSALLEVLDPEQNFSFMDHYLDLEYDLSKVFFIATANSLNPLPSALLDRMEVIHLEGYTEPEKRAIATDHLMPRQLQRHGMQDAGLEWTRNALNELIRSYTREAGVRGLERSIEKILRKLARERVEAEEQKVSYEAPKINTQLLRRLLGPPKFNRSDRDREPLVGVANGLAWTATGGELLSIEVNLVPGNGKLSVTGKLGEVMKESAQAALSVVRKRAETLLVDRSFYQGVDIHIHVPEGAVPKDGPSAGITIATALASELVGLPVRDDLAMTGEITLRGRILPIGGLKEKLLAAVRYGIGTVLIPADNGPDLEQVPESVRKQLQIVLVSTIDEVFNHALITADSGGLYAFLADHPPSMDYLFRGPGRFTPILNQANDHESVI